MPNNNNNNNDYINWECMGRHWDTFFTKHNDVYATARALELSIDGPVFGYEGNICETKIFQRSGQVRTRVVARITTHYAKGRTKEAHYLRLCQLANYFDPENCHYYHKTAGWTTRPRFIGETAVAVSPVAEIVTITEGAIEYADPCL